jgi:hypothetical protein
MSGLFRRPGEGHFSAVAVASRAGISSVVQKNMKLGLVQFFNRSDRCIYTSVTSCWYKPASFLKRAIASRPWDNLGSPLRTTSMYLLAKDDKGGRMRSIRP